MPDIRFDLIDNAGLRDDEVALLFSEAGDGPVNNVVIRADRAFLWDIYNTLGKYLARKMGEEGC